MSTTTTLATSVNPADQQAVGNALTGSLNAIQSLQATVTALQGQLAATNAIVASQAAVLAGNNFVRLTNNDGSPAHYAISSDQNGGGWHLTAQTGAIGKGWGAYEQNWYFTKMS